MTAERETRPSDAEELARANLLRSHRKYIAATVMFFSPSGVVKTNFRDRKPRYAPKEAHSIKSFKPIIPFANQVPVHFYWQ